MTCKQLYTMAEAGDQCSQRMLPSSIFHRRDERLYVAMMTLEPWSAVDQLLFLIDGLRQAIVHAAELESEQLRLFRTIADVESVSFESDVEISGRASLRLRGIRDDRIPVLNKLLHELEREVRA